MSSHKAPSTPEERINAACGYRAALHNPRVSSEAKQHARKMLQELDEVEAREELYKEGVEYVPHHRHHRRPLNYEEPTSPQERINAARGYKAALHNPLVSEEGKEHARKMFQKMDDEEARQELYAAEEKPKDPIRVAAGLKDAQHNPLVSEEGHRRATEKLHQMGRQDSG